MSAQGTSRWWIPVPAWSAAVRWCADAESELDALEVAALGLLRNEARTIDTLVDRLGVSDDVVLSALLKLADCGMVTPPDSSTGRWHAEREVEYEGVELRAGRAFVTIYGGIEAVSHLDDRTMRVEPDSKGNEEDVFDLSLVASVKLDKPRHEDVQASLGRAVARGALLCPPRIVGGRPQEPVKASLVRIEPLDENGQRRYLRRAIVWSAVDVLPGLSGDATLAFHEPQLQPHGAVDTPVSAPLGDWIRVNAPDVVHELERRVRGLAIDRSIVLRAANLGSIEELDVAVRRHREELAVRLGVTLPPSWWPALAAAGAPIDEASRWLILSRREPRFRDALRRCQAAAVEALAQALWVSVQADLRAWADVWRPRLEQGSVSKVEKRARYSEEAANSRLVELGLAERLGPSLEHLLRSTASLSTTLKAIDRGEPGAGESVTLWLLPLTLFEREAAQRHALCLSSALECHPHLFDSLDRLIDARNVIVHAHAAIDNALANQPDDLEASVLRVAAAIAASIGGQAP